MKSYKLVVLIFLNFIFQYSNAQTVASDIIIGKKYSVPSSILKGDREIRIYLPEGYNTSEKQYPVLYLLDGQIHFTNGVAIQQSLRVPGIIPEMIVVGIMNNYPRRTDLRSDNRADYLSFFEMDLIPFIDRTFRTTKSRVLFGWETGAFFATSAVLKKNSLFDGVILSNGGGATAEMLNGFKALSTKNDKYLYLANSIKDIYTISYSDELSKMLRSEAPNHLIWKYEKFDEETHETLPYLALFHGLKYYYHNYGTLDFSSFQEYEDLGGLNYIKKYFTERGSRFGFSTEIDDSTKNGLIWMAWNKDNFDYFKFFMNEFKDVLSTKRYDSAYWQNRLGQMYLKHNDLDLAISFFNNGINKYGDSKELAEMYFGLSKVYVGKNDKKAAVRNVKKAIKTAEIKSDSNLKIYKDFLSQLK